MEGFMRCGRFGCVVVLHASAGITERLPVSSRCVCDALAMDAERRRYARVMAHCRARLAQLRMERAVSYTHLRAHETRRHL
eukprot:6470150-Prorocentrum_lima.AAC.1